MPRVLILGGTAEARLLAERLAGRSDLTITLSLAGRTASPARQPVPVRVGGFGGSAGTRALPGRQQHRRADRRDPSLRRRYLGERRRGCAQTGVAFVALRRPAWSAIAGDRWTEVSDVHAAIRALGIAPRRVFVTLGRNELKPFLDAPQHHYLIRSVDPVDPPLVLPHAAYVTGRGPFSEADDRALMLGRGIEILIAKNSGGTASYGKIAAARTLGIGVILLRRPNPSAAPAVETIEDTIAWLDHALASAAARGV